MENRDILVAEKALEELLNSAPNSTERKRYALIINGDDSQLHLFNVLNAHNTLRNMGYEEKDIMILSEEVPQLYEFFRQSRHIHLPATKEAVRLVTAHLASTVDNNDIVTIYTTGHGDRVDGQSVLCLSDGVLTASAYQRVLEPIDAEGIASVMDQCFSGGFPMELEDFDGRIVAVSNTDDSHTTYCKTFASAFWEGLLSKETDTNGDGDISLREAYDRAMAAHRADLRFRKDETNGLYVATGGIVDIVL